MTQDPDSSHPSSAGPRDIWVDHLKAMAIVGVVCIHAGFPFLEIFRFGVPVFVGLWAYYIEKSLQRRAWAEQTSLLRRKWKELAVPYFAWTLFYVAFFYIDRLGSTPWHTIVGGWFGGFGWSGQYFFIVLLQLVILMPLLRRCVTPRSVVPVIVLGVAFNAWAGYKLFDNRLFSAVGDRLFVYWIPYVFLGMALARGYFKGKRMSALALPAVALLSLAPWESARFDIRAPYFPLTVMTASLLLMLAAISADRQAREHGAAARKPGVVARASILLGQNTFAVYVGNVLMLHALQRTGVLDVARAQGGVLGLLLSIALVIVACLALGLLLQRLGLGILVGKPMRTGN